MLHTYLTSLKTVKVILMPSADSFVQNLSRKWLSRHFHVTEVGLPVSVNSSMPSLSEVGISLNYPQGSIARIFTELSPDITADVRDGLVLSSCYLTPLLVIGDDSWNRLKRHAFWLFRSPKLPGQNELTNALQSANLVTSKLFPNSQEAFQTIIDYVHGDLKNDSLDILIEKRRILAVQEMERTFGQCSENPQGLPFVFIADPIRLIASWLVTMKRTIIAKLPWDEFIVTGLGFSVGVIATAETLRHSFQQRHRHRKRKDSFKRPHHS